jgi:glycosyltransferase involved in cell wall biosynthesis
MSIRNQTYKNVEMIVVDNFSTDRTREIAINYAKIVKYNGSRSAARNLGIAVANGEFVLSLDSDMALMPTVIEECINKAKKGYDVIIIPEIAVGQGFWAKCRALEKSCYIGDGQIEAGRFLIKKVLKVVGAYDPELVFGEDWDLHQRIKNCGFKITRVKAVIQHDEGRLSVSHAMLKKRYYGKSLKLYQSKHPKQARENLKIIRPAYLRNWRYFIKDPPHAMGLILLKACEFSAVLIGTI